MGWQVGDLAVCVDKGGPEWAAFEVGIIYRVIGVGRGTLNPTKEIATGLTFAGVSNVRPLGYWSEFFRKIRPDEHEACEPEFVTLLKRSKGKVHPDPMRRVA